MLLYESTLRLAEINGRRFADLYNLTVSELCSQFGEKFVLLDQNAEINAKTPADCKLCHPEYSSAIVNNIIYLDSPDKTVCKEMSLSERAEAYTAVWRKLCGTRPAKPAYWL